MLVAVTGISARRINLEGIIYSGRIGLIPEMISDSETSGLAGIAYWINNNYNLPEDELLDKHDPLVTSLKEWIDKEYEGGRVATLSISELEEQIEKLSNGKYKRI